MQESIFFQIGLIIIVATLGGYLFKLLKQPLIPAYVLVGVVLGPILGLVTDQHTIAILSEIGIAFLLFTVGLEFDLKRMRNVGAIASIGSLAAMALTFGLGMFLMFLFGVAFKTAAFVGIALMFSSTMVVVKLLSDRREIDTLHGRIIIGILLMQDVVAIIVLSFISSSGHTGPALFLTLIEGAALVAISFIMGKKVYPYIFRRAAQSQELLFLLSLTVCFVFSILFYMIGLSIAIGAFVAGISLAGLPYNFEIESKVKSIKDFFTVTFFTVIGASLVFTDINWLLIIVLTLFVVLVKPLILLLVTFVYGYSRGTALLVASSLSQLSEFSMIILGAIVWLDPQVYSMVIIVMILSIAISSYYINFNREIYRYISPLLKIFEKMQAFQREELVQISKKGHPYILIGYDRIGYSIMKTFKKQNKDFVVVDFNPDIVRRLISQNIPCIYGDIADLDILDQLNLAKSHTIVSTVPDTRASILLIKKIKEVNSRAIIIVTSLLINDALELYDVGADYVIMPHLLGGEHMSIMLEEISVDLDKLINKKLSHIEELHHRKVTHPHHL